MRTIISPILPHVWHVKLPVKGVLQIAIFQIAYQIVNRECTLTTGTLHTRAAILRMFSFV